MQNFIRGLTALALLSCKGDEPSKPAVPAPAPKAAPVAAPTITAEDLQTDLEKRNAAPKHGAMSVEEAGEHLVNIVCISDGATRDETQATTTGIVNATIQAFIARGQNPRTTHTVIVVEARASVGQSVTGAEQIVSLGTARYDPAADSVSFQEASRAPFNVKPWTDDTQINEAQNVARMYVRIAFPSWSREHAGKACPTRLDELGRYIARKDTLDPWGRPFRMLCGGALPAGSPPIAVTSDGPDKKPGTPDDLRSWE